MNEQISQRKIFSTTTAGGCCGSPASSFDASTVTAKPPETGEVKDIKRQVQEHYGGLVKSPASGCCSKGPRQAVSIPSMAGYENEVLAGIPAAAAEKSFGCGDPLAFAGVQTGQTVLDIGSGAGIDCFIASQKVGPTGRVIGLDMTPAMLEAARRNAREGGYTNVEFRQGDAENMPVESASVDWVISNCVINLSPEKEKVFAEIDRVLKPGGRISISDIVANALPDFVREDKLAYCGCIGGAIPENEYLRLLTQAGLVDVQIETRLDYTPEQIYGMIFADAQLKEKYGALVEANPAVLEQMRISSIKISGRKPLPDEKVTSEVTPAKAGDLPIIEELLQKNGLPIEGLRTILDFTLVARHNRRIVGAIALERYGDDGLIRSFVVAPAWRGRGVGRQLGMALLQRAAVSSVRTAYLLTNTIRDLAAKHGFREISRDEVPAAVRKSVEFRLNCCEGAVAMKYSLAR